MPAQKLSIGRANPESLSASSAKWPIRSATTNSAMINTPITTPATLWCPSASTRVPVVVGEAGGIPEPVAVAAERTPVPVGVEVERTPVPGAAVAARPES